jgi:hypothetical protein
LQFELPHRALSLSVEDTKNGAYLSLKESSTHDSQNFLQ